MTLLFPVVPKLNVRNHQDTWQAEHGNPKGSTCYPHASRSRRLGLARSAPKATYPLLLSFLLLRQSLIFYLRDTVQNPYLSHPHSRLPRCLREGSSSNSQTSRSKWHQKPEELAAIRSHQYLTGKQERICGSRGTTCQAQASAAGSMRIACGSLRIPVLCLSRVLVIPHTEAGFTHVINRVSGIVMFEKKVIKLFKVVIC
jgi:hypothetical protein